KAKKLLRKKAANPKNKKAIALKQKLDHLVDEARKGKGKVSGAAHIGLDDFGKDAEELKKEHLLREDFNEGDNYEPVDYILPKGEAGAGKKKKSADFKDLASALEAMAARLAYDRSRFLRDAREVLGEKRAGKLTQTEIDYWTYIYYNCKNPGE